MNILFLMKVYEMGGQEVVTATLAKCFTEHNHNVSIVSFNAPSKIMINRTDKRINIFSLGNFSYSKKNIEKLRNILIKNKIQIVINQWGLPYIPAKVLNKAQKGLDIKTIAIYHNSPDTNARIQEVNIALSNTTNFIKKSILYLKKYIYKVITRESMKYVYNKSNLYMVLSPSFIEKFKNYTKITNPNHLIYLTNPITIDSDNYQYSINTKQKEIIYVGRIDYNQKRVYRIIDVWSNLESQFSDWKLTIVGDGIERHNLEKKVEALKLRRINFVGFQSPEIYYKRASMLMLTSEYEGFPLVLAECMSFGVIPVVYGSYSAVYDIIKHNVNGIIILPNKGQFYQKLMVQELSELMNNPIKREVMGLEAIKTSKQYSLEQIYTTWNSIFNSLKNE